MKTHTRYLPTRSIGVLAIGFLVSTLMAPYSVSAQPHLSRKGENLIPNSRIAGMTGWTVINGAAFDASVSRTNDGSGSINVGPEKSMMISSKVPVVHGKTYTYGMYLKEDGELPGTLRVFVQVVTSSGAFVRNASGTNQGISEKNKWYESVVTFTPKKDDHYVRLMATRLPGESVSVDNVWVDEVYFGEGIGFEQVPTPKKEFSGGTVKVDALGNVEVLKNSTWQPFFPLCMFMDNQRPDWGFYSNQGFNCNMWAAGAHAVQKAKKATSSFNPDGMMSAFEIAPYTAPFGWGYNNLSLLQENLESIKNAGLFDQILMYYWDNEKAFDQWTVPLAVTNLIKKLDVDSLGRRLHPIYALQGQHGTARMYNNSNVHMTEIVGTYSSLAGNDGGAGGSASGLIVLDNIEGQSNPVVIAQINAGTEVSFREKLYNAIIEGAKGIGYWRDFYNSSQGKSVDQRSWWTDFPNMRKEIDQLLPVIRQPHWTNWTVSPNSETTSISIGTREYEKEGYVILANNSSSSETVKLKIYGLTYQPQEVKDYFTGQKVTDVIDGMFTITLPGKGIGKGTAVYHLVKSIKNDDPPASPQNVKLKVVD